MDADTLAALLQEARRQRRSLRQLLLAGNYLTLYQMALIEAGNLDGLVLGPVRVIDRLQSGPREAVYRVFDPRRNGEALLRCLAEAEMHDAVHPDEFRQRFAAAAAVRHVHVAATYEVLEIAGRPAVLQEWLTGLPGSDWPALSSAPGVWFRLLSQAGARPADGPRRRPGPRGADGGVVRLHAGGRREAVRPGRAALAGRAAAAGRRRGRRRRRPAGAGPDRRRLGRVRVGRPAQGQGQGAARGAGRRTGPAHRPRPSRPTQARPSCSKTSTASAPTAPANATAWERFVREVREQAADAAWRRSA